MNFGLLGGIGQGLSSFADSYRTERDYQEKKQRDALDKKLKDRQYKADLVKSGYKEDLGGGLVRTEESEQERAWKRATDQGGLAKQGYQVGEYDPEKKNYDISKISGFKDAEDDLKRAQADYYRKKASEASAPPPPLSEGSKSFPRRIKSKLRSSAFKWEPSKTLRTP
jgi:hypothetical protein